MKATLALLLLASFSQAQRLGAVLREAGIPVRVYGAKETSHDKINDNPGLPTDPATGVLFQFVDELVKR